MGDHDGGVEIGVVDLIAAGGAKELGAVDVEGNLMAGSESGVVGGVGAARDGGADEAGVEAAGSAGGAGGAGGAAGDLAGVAAELGAAGGAGAEAAVEGAEGRPAAGAVGREVGARRRETEEASRGGGRGHGKRIWTSDRWGKGR